MGGCDTRTDDYAGNYDSMRDRVTRWAWITGGITAVLAYMNIVGAGGMVSFAGWPAVLGLLAIGFALLAGAGLGFWVGFAVEWFDRLKEQNPKTITISGLVVCAGKNSGIPPWADGDWTFNVGEAWAVHSPLDAGLDMNEIRTRAAPDSGQSVAFTTRDPQTFVEMLHCEIGSHIGDYAAVGGAVGSVAGAIGGAIAGAAICAALGIVTFGLALAVCALIVAALAAAGAWVGGFAGNLIGGGIGAIADELSDFDKRGKAIQKGCQMFFTGTWVTDTGHQHNEIHDIESAQLIECDVDSTTKGLRLSAAVGIGRHPTGRDP